MFNARKSADAIIEVIHAKNTSRGMVARMLAVDTGDATTDTRARRIAAAITDAPDAAKANEQRAIAAERQRATVLSDYQKRYAELAQAATQRIEAARDRMVRVIAALSGLGEPELSAFTWLERPDGSAVAAAGPFQLKVVGTAWSVSVGDGLDGDAWLDGGAGTDNDDARDRAIGCVRHLHGLPVNFKPEL